MRYGTLILYEMKYAQEINQKLVCTIAVIDPDINLGLLGLLRLQIISKLQKVFAIKISE